ncbi:MAG: hypothetical protein ACREOD_07040 [Candidatus Dormibacteria bacterium]
MSQMDVIVIHIRKEQAQEYERLFEQEELVRWREYHRAGKFLNARFYRSEFGSEQSADVVRYVIVVEVPSMAEHSAHDQDPGFRDFDQKVDSLQPRPPLVFGGDLVHAVG